MLQEFVWPSGNAVELPAVRSGLGWVKPDGETFLFGGQRFVAEEPFDTPPECDCPCCADLDKPTTIEEACCELQGSSFYNCLGSSPTQSCSADRGGYMNGLYQLVGGGTAGASWTEVKTGSPPVARSGSAGWVDSAGVAFVFGGVRDAVAGMDDLWRLRVIPQLREQTWERVSGSAAALPPLNTAGMTADARDLAIDAFYRSTVRPFAVDATYPAGRAFATATSVGVTESARNSRQSSPREAAEAGWCAGYIFGGAAVVPRTAEPMEGGVARTTDPVAFNDLWRFDCLANGTIAWARLLLPPGLVPSALAPSVSDRFTDSVGLLQRSEAGVEEGWPSSRYHHAAWAIGGRLCVFGGLGTGPGRAVLELADLWCVLSELDHAHPRASGRHATVVWRRLGGGGVSVHPAPEYMAALWPSRAWEPSPPPFPKADPAPANSSGWLPPRYGSFAWASGNSAWIYSGATSAMIYDTTASGLTSRKFTPDLWRFDFAEQPDAPSASPVLTRLTEVKQVDRSSSASSRAHRMQRSPVGRAMATRWVGISSGGHTQAGCFGGVTGGKHPGEILGDGSSFKAPWLKEGPSGYALDDFLTREVGFCADPTCETRTIGGETHKPLKPAELAGVTAEGAQTPVGGSS